MIPYLAAAIALLVVVPFVAHRLAARRAVRRFVVAPLKVREGRFDDLVRMHLGEPDALDDGTHVGPAIPGTGSRAVPENRRDFLRPVNGSRLGVAPVLVDAAIPALDVWHRWSSVDDHVFTAVQHLTHEQVGGFADLLRVVQAKQYSLETAGFFNKLLGHVGEAHVIEHLQAAGMAPSIPLNSNEPGADLYLHDQGVNVKTVADAGHAASAHFADHPDISVIVPYDAAHIPDSALHFDPSHGVDPSVLGGEHVVLVDDALSHANVMADTGNAVDVLQDPGVHLHIPWITMAVSSFRESRLLIAGNTDLGRAAKNVAVDTAAVGGGGAVGAKAGAMLGTFVGGPVGTVVGGILGGAIGAFAGRHAANTIKRRPLEAAKQAYDEALGRYQVEERRITEEAKQAWEGIHSSVQSCLATEAHRLEEAFLGAAQVQFEALRQKTRLSELQADAEIGAALQALDRRIEIARGTRDQAAPGLRSLFPWFFAPAEQAVLRAAVESKRAWLKELERVKKAGSDTRHVFDLVMAIPERCGSALAFVRRVRLARRGAYEAIHEENLRLLAALAEARAACVGRLEAEWEGLKRRVEEQLSSSVDRLRSSSDSYRSELRKAGVSC